MKVGGCMRHRGLISALVGLLCMVMLSSSGVLAAALTNGDFEPDLTGWTVSDSAETAAVTTFTEGATTITPQHGAHFAVMHSGAAGAAQFGGPTLQQYISVLPGGIVSGYYYFVPDPATPTRGAKVELWPCNPSHATCTTFSDLVTVDMVNIVDSATATGGWAPFTYTFPAGSPYTLWQFNLVLNCFGFGGNTCPNGAVGFDNVQYTPPPSPATATSVTTSPTPTYSTTNQNVTLSASVTAASPVNEGTVTFTVKQGATTIGVPVTSSTVASGAASATYVLPGGTPVGAYTITAVYNPAVSSPNFTTSSGGGSLTVNKAATNVSVPTVTTPFSVAAQNVTLSATVTSTTPVNEGTVKFSVRQGVSTIIGSPVTSGTVVNGAASVTYSLPGNTPVGGYSIDALYQPAASNPNFLGFGNSGTLNINPNPTPVIGVANPNFESGVTGWQGFGTGGSANQFNVAVHASVTNTLTKGGTTITPQSLTKFGELDSITGGNAPAVIYQNISVLPGGTLTGYYYFVPDSGAGANPNAALQIELLACDPNGAPPCTLAFPTVSSFPVNTTAATGGWLPFSYTFPAGPYKTWALNLILNCPVAASGTESCPNAAAAFDNFVYTLPTTTTAVTDTTTPFSATAQNVTLNATVSSASPVNEGTVTFTVMQGATTIGAPVTSATVANGLATVTYALPAGTPTGPYTINAVYNIAPTNTNFQASSGNGTLTVTPDVTTLAVANVTTPSSSAAQNVTLTATVTGPSSVDEGTVTFTVMQGATTIGAPVTSATVASGLASVMYALPAGTSPGAYTISAVYNPVATTPKFQTSTSTGTLTVTGTVLTTLAVSAPINLGNPPTIKVGQQAQLTATATVNGAASDVTNQSQWSSNNTGVAKVDPATGRVTGQSPGTATITATYTLGGVTKTGSILVTVTGPTAIGILPVPVPQGRSAGAASAPSGPDAVGIPAPIPGGR